MTQTAQHTATPTDKQILAAQEFANKHAVTVQNAYIGYSGDHMDAGAAYAIAEAMAPACACNAHDQLVAALKEAHWKLFEIEKNSDDQDIGKIVKNTFAALKAAAGAA